MSQEPLAEEPEKEWPPAPQTDANAASPPVATEGESHTQLRVWQAIAAYLAFGLLIPWIPIPMQRLPLFVLAALAIVPTMAFMLLQLWLARALVRLRPTPAQCALAAAGSVVFWFVISRIPVYRLPSHLFLGLLQVTLMSLAITLAFTFLGTVLSRIVREPNVLLPIALIAMPIDYLGAMTNIGFTNNFIQHHPKVVQQVSVAVPQVGGATHGGGLHILAMIGPGDALFIAFFLALVLRLRLNERGTFWGMYGLLTVTMLLVITFGLNIAALVPMGIAVIAANVRFFRFTRAEVFASIYAGSLIFALVIGFYFYSHAHFFRHP